MQTAKVDFRRAEFRLVLFGVLGFGTFLISIKTIYGGLPAHPLFVHVPVVLIPVTILGALACVAKPKLLDSYGVLLCSVAIVAMSATFLAMQAGGALQGALHLQGRAAHLIGEHSAAATVLAIVFTLVTVCLILTLASSRIRGGRPLQIGFIDAILRSNAAATGVRVALVVLALVAAYYVYRVGDLGAKAVWAGRLQASAHQAAVPGS
jgi:uncharacterized membrane protein